MGVGDWGSNFRLSAFFSLCFVSRGSGLGFRVCLESVVSKARDVI